MCRSEAPFSTIALSSCWRLTVGCVTPVPLPCVPSKLAPRSVRGGDAGDLVERAGPLANLGDAAHAQGAHAVADGLVLELDRGGPLQHQLLERLGHRHALVDRDAPLVAGAGALLAALALGAGGGVDLLVLGSHGAQPVL